MKKFEYFTLVGFSVDDRDLNNLGKEGWELVSVVYNYYINSYRYVFKREK